MNKFTTVYKTMETMIDEAQTSEEVEKVQKQLSAFYDALQGTDTKADLGDTGDLWYYFFNAIEELTKDVEHKIEIAENYREGLADEEAADRKYGSYAEQIATNRWGSL